MQARFAPKGAVDSERSSNRFKIIQSASQYTFQPDVAVRQQHRQTSTSDTRLGRSAGVAAGGSFDRATFWVFIAGLAWTPFWYGSNDLVAWGINAVLFPGLAAAYEVSLLVKGEPHPIAIKNLGVPAALFAVVVGWILFQNATWASRLLAHPIWDMASKALEQPLAASISVNRDLTTLALVRLMTSASVFWIAVQLCRNALRASRLIEAVATIGATYSAYGLVAFAANTGRLSWFETSATGGFLSSTFINKNSFATYAGICLVAVCGLILRLYRHQVVGNDGPRRHRIASFIKTTGQRGIALLGGAFLIIVALLLTGSRGGMIAATSGLIVLGILTLRRDAEQFKIMAFAIVLVATVCIGFGATVFDALTQRGLGDSGRLAVYTITLRSIFDAPLSGFGYGTFVDVFPMYRDRSISLVGVWEQAHNTYLEVFQGLGLVFGSLLVSSVLLLIWSCVQGAIGRRGNSTISCVAASVAFLVGIQALFDFGLQIQAVTLTFAAILGAGVAQAQSSREFLED